MLFVISPAKSLDFESAALTDKYTAPLFLDKSKVLIDILKQYQSEDISKLMGVSSAIADLNVARNNDWSSPFSLRNAKQAIYAFKGDVYTGISVETAEQPQVDYIQNHVRILSGLYGVLRPLDLMQAYRLEMGTRLENPEGKNLYAFWGSACTDQLNNDLSSDSGATETEPVIVNLASNEYYKAVKPKSLNARVITPIFKDLKAGKYKIISFYAKKARGLMVRYAADNLVSDPEQLKGFDYQGYAFNAALSSDNDWVFTRDTPPATK